VPGGAANHPATIRLPPTSSSRRVIHGHINNSIKHLINASHTYLTATASANGNAQSAAENIPSGRR